MHELEEEPSHLSYLLEDVQPKSYNEKMLVNALLFGDIDDSEADSELEQEEGRSERDYFRLSPTDFIPSVYNSTIDFSDVNSCEEENLVSQNEAREKFDDIKKSLEAVLFESLEVPTRAVDRQGGSRALKQFTLNNFGIKCNDNIPTFEDSFPTYWAADRYVKSFICEGGWISKDLYLLRGLENETYSKKKFINFIYKGERISTKARFKDDENKGAKHKDVKCYFNPKCKWNKDLHSVRELQTHHHEDHRAELRALKRPMDPLVPHFENQGWYI